jgi:putative thioredoxin
MSATETWIIDVDTPSFTREVVERSMQVPVLVDLWATWCEPCKSLGPVLEKLANDDPGRFVLAKADVDQSPELMQAFGLTSVPAVILFVEGKPVDAFLGAKSAAEVGEFLDKHLGPAGAGDGDGDVVTEARELFAAGDFETAVMALEAEAEEDDGDPRAAAVLAELHFENGDVERARELYAALSEASLATTEAQAIGAKLSLAEGAGDLAELRAAVERNPKDISAHLALGKALVAAGDAEAGLDELLEACMRDMHFEDDAPRKALLEVFAALGTADPLVVEYQQRLSVLLCS